MISIRGAIVVDDNTKEKIVNSSKALLEKMIKENDIKTEEIVSILFTATKDLTAAYPAVAARELGINAAGLFCMQEMFVENSLSRCVRTLMYVNNDDCQTDVKHIYLNGAEVLRPDLLS